MILICDIDGTIGDSSHRAHLVDGEVKNWEAFLDPTLVIQDPPIIECIKPMHWFEENAETIIFLTGRNEGLRECTEKWIKTHLGIVVRKDTLLMRPLNNLMKPTEYKGEQISKLSKKYKNSVILAFDDDKYMMECYLSYNILPFLAPDCWLFVAPTFNDLSPEVHWRK